MGLDLVPMGKALQGRETEWSAAMDRLYRNQEETPQQAERRLAVSDRPYETLGAPRVGTDAAADAWLLGQMPKDSPKTDSELLAECRGYFALALLAGKCDGIPRFSHGGLYEGVDETSFRGKFLELCTDLLDKAMIDRAWTTAMPPEDAVRYGRTLLAAAEAEPLPKPTPGLLRRLFKSREEDEKAPLEEQREILSEAGRWYVFWGSRGHPVGAFY